MEKLHQQERDNAVLRNKIEVNDLENKQLIMDEIQEMKQNEQRMELELKQRLENLKASEQETIKQYVTQLCHTLQITPKEEESTEKAYE